MLEQYRLQLEKTQKWSDWTPQKLENKRKNTFKNSKLQRTQKKIKTAQ